MTRRDACTCCRTTCRACARRRPRTVPRAPARPSRRVSIGLQGDAIQPLTVRVNQDDCVYISLRNDLGAGEPASLHLHGSGLYVAGLSQPAIATNRAATADPGETVEYQWMVAPDEPEGTHYFHSHGNDREQSGPGLFGALI